MQYLIAAILVVVLASASAPPSPPAHAEQQQYKTVNADVTAYSSVPEQTDSTPFITASGSHVHPGTLACPPELAFGTKVEIAGETYICEDRMNTKFSERYDIWMASNDDAVAWGLKKESVKILLSTM